MKTLNEFLKEDKQVLKEAKSDEFFETIKAKKIAQTNLSDAASKIIGTRVDLLFYPSEKAVLYVKSKQELTKALGMRMFSMVLVEGYGDYLHSEALSIKLNYYCNNFIGGPNRIDIGDFWFQKDGTLDHERPSYKMR